MKYIFTFIILLTAYNNSIAQINFPAERITEIASLETSTPRLLEFKEKDIGIESNIRRHLQLGDRNLVLHDPKVVYDKSSGWVLQYAFSSTNAAGLYKETLLFRNGKLVITESRNAVMGYATNCHKLTFTEDQNRCKCAEKKNPNLKSETMYRLFTSNR